MPDGEWEYEGDERVYRIDIGGGSQTIWLVAQSFKDAIGEAESMDYFYDEPEDEVAIRQMPPEEHLSIWLCDYQRDDVSDRLKPFIVEEPKEEDGIEWSTLTVKAPCAVWAEEHRGRACLLADSEASC